MQKIIWCYTIWFLSKDGESQNCIEPWKILPRLPGKFTHVACFILKIIKELQYCLTLVIIISVLSPLLFECRVQRLTLIGSLWGGYMVNLRSRRMNRYWIRQTWVQIPSTKWYQLSLNMIICILVQTEGQDEGAKKIKAASKHAFT